MATKDGRHPVGLHPIEIKKMALIVAVRQDLQMMDVGRVTHKALEEWFAEQAKKHKLQIEMEKIENGELVIETPVWDFQAHSLIEKNTEAIV